MKVNGLHLPKNYIPSANTLYTEDLNHKSFFTTQLVYFILAQTLHTFDRNIPSKSKFSDFSLLKLESIKFLMSFFKKNEFGFHHIQKNFGSLFSVMRDNSSVLFSLKLYMISTKGAHPSAKFQTFDCSR